jgi:alkanesulfonate monooxygenase SsuD/methylene tetrahydromethanopterin reductase-like flavin-dependent oxidoreductase (luciferase family)
MACVNVIASDTDDEAQYLATSGYQAFLGIMRGKPVLLQPPVKNMNAIWNEYEAAQIKERLSGSFIGSAATVEKGLQKFVAKTHINELMVTAHIFDFNAKLHSYELLSEVMGARAVYV